MDDARYRHGGKSFRVGGEYRSIERPHLLVFTWLPDWYANAKIRSCASSCKKMVDSRRYA